MAPFKSDPDTAEKTSPLMLRAPIVLTLVTGAALMVATFMLWRSWELQKIQFQFQSAADNHISALNGGIDITASILGSVRALHLSSEEVKPEEFRKFVNLLLEMHPVLTSFEWIVRNQENPSGQPTFRIAASVARSFENRLADSDLAVSGPFADAMQAACDSGATTAALSASRQPDPNGSHLGYRLFMPVYHKGTATESGTARNKALNGYVSCAVGIPALIQRAWRDLDDEKISIFVDFKTPGEPVRYAFNNQSKSLEPYDAKLSKAQLVGGATLSQGMTVKTLIDQWDVLMVPTPEYYFNTSFLPAYGISLAIMLATISVALFVRSGIKKKDLLFDTNRQLRREIHERHIAQKALRKERDFSNTLIQASPILFIAVDSKGVIEIGNQVFLDTTGYTADEIIGKNFLSLFIRQEDRQRVETTAQILAKRRKTMIREGLLKTKDRNKVLIEWHLTPLFNGQEKPDYFIGVGIDISERRRKEEALRESEERYAKLIETSPDGIFITSLTCRFLEANQAFEQLIGYPNADLQQMSCLDLIADRHRSQWADLPNIVATRAFYGPVEIDFVDPKGALVPVSLNGWAIRDRKGNPEKLGFVVQDIRVRKQAEKEKANLTNQLLQAQKLESIGTLAGGIAHDFNNILGIIIGYAELARDADAMSNGPRSDDKGYFDQILAAAGRAKELVGQILTVSRQTDQKRLPLHIRPLVKETMKFLRASIPSTIDIQADLDRCSGVILANPTQMHQVLMNLSTNSAHAMRAAGGVLRIELTHVHLDHSALNLNPGPHIKLTVHDTGHGIEPQILDRIFDPYFTTKEIGQGTGLGLAMVHSIVQSYGGAIRVESAQGKGTTFELLFPEIEDIECHTKTAPSIEMPVGNEQILLVDDEEQLVGIGKKILSRLGYRVVGKTDSLAALEAFEVHPDAFDLVITDMTMPRMTGIVLAQRLKTIKPEIPILLCTGFSNNLKPEYLASVGIQGIIEKPILPADLAKSVRALLDGDDGGPGRQL